MEKQPAYFLTPLMRAAAIGQTARVMELIAEGVDVNVRGPRNSTALMYAASGGHLDVVRVLVESGADVMAREAGGWTARRHAEEDGYTDVSDFLSEVEEHIHLKWGNAE